MSLPGINTGTPPLTAIFQSLLHNLVSAALKSLPLNVCSRSVKVFQGQGRKYRETLISSVYISKVKTGQFYGFLRDDIYGSLHGFSATAKLFVSFVDVQEHYHRFSLSFISLKRLTVTPVLVRKRLPRHFSFQFLPL